MVGLPLQGKREGMGLLGGTLAQLLARADLSSQRTSQVMKVVLHGPFWVCFAIMSSSSVALAPGIRARPMGKASPWEPDEAREATLSSGAGGKLAPRMLVRKPHPGNGWGRRAGVVHCGAASPGHQEGN